MTIAKLSAVAIGGFLLYNCVQGSPEWLQARAGVITASEFAKARATYKVPKDRMGQPKDTALDYAFQKAIERISGVPLDENFQTWQMKRGHELEPLARIAHEDLLARKGGDLANMIVQTAGFMTTVDGKFGASVDGLIGERGGGEYKCLASAGKLRKVVLFNDIDAYLDQIQGCMWISGREWWHFGLYCPALAPVGLEFQMIEVQRDDDYIEALERDLVRFEKTVTDYELQLREMGAQAIEAAAEEVRRRLAEPAGAEPMFADEEA